MDIGIMWRLLGQLSELRQHERWNRTQLEAYQTEGLRHLREYAYAKSPFYQKYHQGFVDRPLNELPVVTKSMLMEHFDELATDRAIRLEEVRAFAANGREGTRFLNRYWVNATSGSSGQPGFFLFNETEWLTVLASFARSHEWAGVRVNLKHRMKMGSIASVSPWHMSAQVGATLKSWWMPALRLAASEPLPEIVRQLNEFQPEMLIAYASMARILADEQIAGRLRIQPHLVYTSSEVLTDETSRLVEAVWGQPPFNQYAATETAEIAAEVGSCRRLHLFEDLVIVEVVDEDYQPVPPGEYGAKLLVTTLFSRTQPLIRYEISDSLQLSAEPCACGLPFRVVESIQGRAEDSLSLPSASGGRISIQPLVFNQVLDILPASGWQVIQQADDGLTVLLSGVSDGLMGGVLVERLDQALAAHGARVPHIQVQRMDMIPKTNAGKTPLIRAYRPA